MIEALGTPAAVVHVAQLRIEKPRDVFDRARELFAVPEDTGMCSATSNTQGRNRRASDADAHRRRRSLNFRRDNAAERACTTQHRTEP